jgi:hypothetical protein
LKLKREILCKCGQELMQHSPHLAEISAFWYPLLGVLAILPWHKFQAKKVLPESLGCPGCEMAISPIKWMTILAFTKQAPQTFPGEHL